MISVIIPTYNREKTLMRAIESVLNQTYRDLELIISDDCSTDHTAELVRGIDDSRVRYICLPSNQGACAARNAGIDSARGEYIAFQDSDDAWLPEKLEKQLAAMESTKADVCYHRMRKHFFNGMKDTLFPEIEESRFMTHDDFCSTTSQISTQTIMAKKEVFEEHRFDPLVKKAQDYDWSIRASRNHTFYYLAEVLAEVYLQPDSISAQKVEVNMRVKQYFMEKYKDELPEHPMMEVTLLRSIAGSKIRMGDNAPQEHRRIWQLTGKPKDLLRLILSRAHLLTAVYKLLGRSDDSYIS